MTLTDHSCTTPSGTSSRHIIPQLLIAAPCSGSGKTTVSRGLMALLRRQGMKVQPFKCGPDYIDTKFHARVCGRPSVNLDSFMATPEHLRELYAAYAGDADACVVEGMMGMYDGYDRDRGSSAEVARLLGLPVVLVVDARSAAYSMAPLLTGFLHFRPDVQVAGVIFNRVGSARHADMLRQVCEDVGITWLGYLPRRTELEQASRYLGLDFSRPEAATAADMPADLLAAHVEWPLLLEKCSLPRPAMPTDHANQESRASASRVIAVARNEESFSFLYEEHLARLRSSGKVVFFDPEADCPLPPDTELLYLPGGYPEKHAKTLSQAQRCLDSIRDYAERGGKVLAECGGMIYLSAGIRFDGPDSDTPKEDVSDGGTFVPMAGVFPFTVSAEKRHCKLSLGYRQFTYNGQTLRGHEFHYTQLLVPESGNLPPSVASLSDAKGRKVSTPVFRYKNVIAGYTHLYWGDRNPFTLFEDKD